MPPEKRHAELELADWLATCYADPLRFVQGAYRWPVHGEPGPDTWQREVLEELGAAVRDRGYHPEGDSVLPIREAISSGHSIGKSALFAWIVDWLMSTRRNCRGTVTANTNDQLDKKTWSAVREWTEQCITAHWFEINSQIMYRHGHRATWFCAPQSCAEENSEAFAGQHAKGSTSFYLFDEASAIPLKIWQVAEGGLTDEPFIVVGGNPTRNTGPFYDAVFGAQRSIWNAKIIDSRDCKLHNRALVAQWLELYGEDSDFFRVRARGLPPRADELQYIDQARVQLAQHRPVEVLGDEPLIAGVDVSGGGSAWTVCRFRRGLDARAIAPIRITGERSVDRGHVTSLLAEALRPGVHEGGLTVAAMFVDTAYGAPIVERLHALGYKDQVHEVNFGSNLTPDPLHCLNMRAYMWKTAKDWLQKGGLPAKDERLAMDLTGPGFHLNQKNQLVLESKQSMRDRGVASPDDADGFVLTFAQPVAPKKAVARPPAGRGAAFRGGPMNWAG